LATSTAASPGARVKKGKGLRYAYRAKCRLASCPWVGELVKSEKAAVRVYGAHASREHVEIERVPVKVVYQPIG
jgi:hypothetical protein